MLDKQMREEGGASHWTIGWQGGWQEPDGSSLLRDDPRAA